MEDGSPPTVLQVYPVHGEKNIYYIRLRTSHYSFSIKSSCVTRSLDSFYQLRRVLEICLSPHHYECVTLYFDGVSRSSIMKCKCLYA